MFRFLKERKSIKDIIFLILTALILLCLFIQWIRYLLLGNLNVSILFTIVNLLLGLLTLVALKTLPFLCYLVVGLVSVLLFFNMNNSTYSNSFEYLFVLILSALCFVASLVFLFWKKDGLRFRFSIPLCAFLGLAIFSSLYWLVAFEIADNRNTVQKEIYTVPKKYDTNECSQQGSLEKITYQTKAYATDERNVSKSAYVYLPYNYDENENYNILYLMHGTGDDEAYWLNTYSYNKVMLDWLIYEDVIDPLIVVTPTFYVEDDCSADLDQLTYSFAKELRNDLMPVIEKNYSTYAESIDSEGFTNSRDHRAFAGLSRGSVTMFHAALCQSLDYFSYFGGFSGSRTSIDYYRETAMSSSFASYSINYLYITSGSFDFALRNQLIEYKALLETDSRLISGVNTSLDVFPMRYHSIGNWHLALYNFLQVLF